VPKTYRIAAIPGDGIGREVVPEGLRCLQAASEVHGFQLDVIAFDFASADYWHDAARELAGPARRL
jgi:tartrate dehydrogenase/decarboxylase/D-malate dehydrogenase